MQSSMQSLADLHQVILPKSVISKSEEIDNVKLFTELDGSILYTPLTMVKHIIEIAKDSLLTHCNQPRRHLVVPMLFTQLET